MEPLPQSSNIKDQPPSPPSSVIRFLVKLDRSLILGLLLGLATFCFATYKVLSLPDPFRAHGQFMLTKSIDNWYLPYRMIQGRPMEKCTSFEPEKKALMARFQAEIDQVPPRWVARINAAPNDLEKARLLVLKAADVLTIYQKYNAEIIQLHHAPCVGEWQRHFTDELFQKWFLIEAAYIWAAEEWGATPLMVDAYLRFLQLLTVVFLFLVVRRMARSSLAGMVAIVILTTLTQWPADWPEAFWHDQFLLIFPVIYAVQLVVDHRLDTEKIAARHWVTWSIAALIFGLYAAATSFVYPPQYRAVAQLMIVVLVIIALMRRQKRLAIPIVMFWLTMTMTIAPLTQAGDSFPSTFGKNHAKPHEFAKAAVIVGQGERPNPYGIPFMDMVASNDPPMFSPLLSRMDRNFFINQTLGAYGGYFLRDILLNHPLVLFESIWKRVYLHIAYPDQLITLFNDGANRGRYAFWWFAFISGVLVLALFPFVRGGRSDVLPAVLAALWSYFGIHVLLQYVHAHDYYTRGGAYIFFCISPGMAFWLGRQRSAILALPGRWGRTAKASYATLMEWRGSGVGNVILVALATIAFLLGGYVVREARKETHAFEILFALQKGYVKSTHNMTPDEIEGHIEAIRSLGGNPPGSVDLFGANVFTAARAWRYRTDNAPTTWYPKGIDLSKVPEYNARAFHLIKKYYRRALATAPDNPFIPAYALRRELPEWRTVFKEAMRKFPDGPFTAYMATFLLGGAPLSQQERVEVAKVYLTNIERHLRETADLRPGLVRIPNVVRAPTSWPKEVENGLSVVLNPGESIHLGPLVTHGSEEMRLAYFLQVRRGSLKKSFGPDPVENLVWKEQSATGDDKVGHYVTHELTFQETSGSIPVPYEMTLIVQAGDQGAEFIIRDFYPLLLRPKIGNNSR